MKHDWTVSQIGHGELMCRRCFATNREAAALGLVECDAPSPPPPKPANENESFYCDEIDDDDCPQCGGTGVLDGECDCMDDTCCCLHPTPPDCPECAMWSTLRRKGSR